jgi:hypothetical protein
MLHCCSVCFMVFIVLCWVVDCCEFILYEVLLCLYSSCISITVVFPLSAFVMVSLFVDNLFLCVISFHSFFVCSIIYVIFIFLGDFYDVFSCWVSLVLLCYIENTYCGFYFRAKCFYPSFWFMHIIF